MYVDASALVAILGNEPEREPFLARLKAETWRITSPVSVFEAAMALRRMTGSCVSALSEVNRFLEIANVRVVEVGESLLPELVITRDRYGKDTGHPARLNLGDCVSYAMAKRAGVTLLYKGDDFAQTDLA